MSKFLAAGFLLAFSACPTQAQVATASQGQGSLELAIGGITASPASINAAQQFNAGTGGEVFLGLPLSKHFTLGLVTGYDSYPYRNALPGNVVQGLESEGWTPAEIAMINVNLGGNYYYVPLLLETKFYFYDDPFRPYGLLAFGGALNQAAANLTMTVNEQSVNVLSTTRELDFLLAFGLGAQLQLAENMDLFLQFRVDINFTSNNNSDTSYFTYSSNGSTYQTTTPASVTGDNPSYFIPFEGGLDFNL